MLDGAVHTHFIVNEEQLVVIVVARKKNGCSIYWEAFLGKALAGVKPVVHELAIRDLTQLIPTPTGNQPTTYRPIYHKNKIFHSSPCFHLLANSLIRSSEI